MFASRRGFLGFIALGGIGMTSLIGRSLFGVLQSQTGRLEGSTNYVIEEDILVVQPPLSNDISTVLSEIDKWFDTPGYVAVLNQLSDEGKILSYRIYNNSLPVKVSLTYSSAAARNALTDALEGGIQNQSRMSQMGYSLQNRLRVRRA